MKIMSYGSLFQTLGKRESVCLSSVGDWLELDVENPSEYHYHLPLRDVDA